MGENISEYHIERQIAETGQEFGDGAHIIYVNGALQDSTPIGKLMHDFSCTNLDDMYYEVLANRTKYFKEEMEGSNAMGNVFDEVREEGRIEASKMAALRMIESGKITIEDIAKFSGLTIEEVKVLEEEKIKTA